MNDGQHRIGIALSHSTHAFNVLTQLGVRDSAMTLS
jgi:hypothetical protein